MKVKFKKGSLFFLNVIMMIVVLLLSGQLMIQYQEKERTPVKLTGTKNVTLFFYRDDCRDCQKVFDDVYWQKISGQKLIFINMNNQSNRRYIGKYDLVSVPTFIKNHHRYVGTNLSKINQVIREDKS